MVPGLQFVLTTPTGPGFDLTATRAMPLVLGGLALVFAVLWLVERRRLSMSLDALERALEQDEDEELQSPTDAGYSPRMRALLRAIGWRRAHGRLLERGLSGLRAQAVLEAVSLESQRLLEAGGLHVASVTCARIRPREGTVESHSRLPDGTRELVVLPYHEKELDTRPVRTFRATERENLPDHLDNLARLLAADGPVVRLQVHPLLAPGNAQSPNRLQGFLAIGFPTPDAESETRDRDLHADGAAAEPPHLAALLRTAGAALSTCGQLLESQHMADDALLALARAADSASTYSRGHSERVSRLAVQVARSLGCLPSEIETLRRAALLHDLGVVALSSRFLDQEEAYDEEDRATMRPHVEHGVEILTPLASLKGVVPVVAQHHEWWDGGGYPAGLAGDEIHPLARILTVVDVYEALTSSRPYRGALPPERALRHLEERSGSQFEPRVVDTLVELVRRTE